MGTIKTTVYLRASDYGKLKRLAAVEGRTAAELVREAVAEYAARGTSSLMPRSLGMAASGEPAWIERYEELMDGFGEDGPVASRALPAGFGEGGSGQSRDAGPGTSGVDEASALKCDEEIPGIPGKP